MLIYLNLHPLKVGSRYRDTNICLIRAQIFAYFVVKTHTSFPITVIWSTNKTDQSDNSRDQQDEG